MECLVYSTDIHNFKPRGINTRYTSKISISKITIRKPIGQKISKITIRKTIGKKIRKKIS